MVEFVVHCLEGEGNTLRGAEVIVYSGDVAIDRIEITDYSQFQEIMNRFDDLGDQYVKFEPSSSLQGDSLETVLQNQGENTLINATRLNGLQSDKFAKVSHQHRVSDLTDLLNYEIWCDRYNVNLGGTATITIRVTKPNGTSAGSRDIVFNNNGSNTTVRTNSDGTYTTTITFQSIGLFTFGVDKQKVQVLCQQDTGWVKLGLKSGFEAWSPGYSDLQYRVKNGVVNIGGIIKPKWNMGNEVTVATLPRYRPPFKVSAIHQGSWGDRFLLDVNTNGDITLSRYGHNGESQNFQTGFWLHIFATYML